ncbi:phosphatidylinositol 4-phosphatase [Nematocida minor]|uniref:phosphatidylinositol 4-phosphatase n=1 Tax=Nematocida minor TaxID=1912983 RepID=UPI00221F93CC|nr:phosphatidylinositol 4-phosphatase [Nematocida minor]KAI5192583.1 phosphatidylinositol 4-phosphatase [Nematocida minor]
MNLDTSRRLIKKGSDAILLTLLEETEDKESPKVVKTATVNKRHNRQGRRQRVIGKSRIIAHSKTKEEKDLEEEENTKTLTEGVDFAGVYGEIDVNEGTYLVYIKESRKVGRLNGKAVYEVLSCGSVCIDGLNDPMIQEMLDDFFKIPGLFYSETDLSTAGTHLEENTDFIYNYIPLSKYQQNNPDAAVFGINVVQGYFGQEYLSGKVEMECTIVSRRSWRNAGTRYYARGADPNGDAANTVETLLIAKTKTETYEFIQCRGSIPLSWEQKINLSYKPPVKMGNSDLSRHLFMKHLNVLRKRYGKYMFITLLDEKGHEKELNSEFTKSLQETGCKYLAVDYHRMMKSAEEKKEFKKSLKDALSHEVMLRTNCVDCLDRTNVVQSQLSKIKLVEMLGLEEESENGSILDIDDYLNESSVKKLGQLWNSNANALSMQYTGTSALKNDLTEHGVRTFKGLIQDAISSGKRYVNNNFTDGRMQEIIELVTGVRQTLGNCIRGDRRIGIYLVLVSILIACLYKHSYYAGNAALACAVVSFRSVLAVYLSFPSPRKRVQGEKENEKVKKRE